MFAFFLVTAAFVAMALIAEVLCDESEMDGVRTTRSKDRRRHRRVVVSAEPKAISESDATLSANATSGGDSRPAQPLYRIRRLTKTYGKGAQRVCVLRDVELDIDDGVTAITGPNGGGKSTLLRMLGALEAPTAGEVFYNGVAMPFDDPGMMNRFRATRPAWIMQENNLFADQTAAQNVAFSLTRYGERYRFAMDAALDQLRAIGIDRRTANRLPHQLSGGQRQRVAIARALLANRWGGAEVILADEPTASVDATDAGRVFQTLVDLAAEQGVPVIVVTHNLALARRADRVLICARGTFRERKGRRANA